MYDTMPAPTPSNRKKITLNVLYNHEQPVQINGLPARIVMRKDWVYIGCYDIRPEVLRHLVEVHTRHFGKLEEVQVQSGLHPC